MLKLEPSEAENVLLPACNQHVEGLTEELEQLIRSGREAAAQARADDVVLRNGLGLAPNEINRLREGAGYCGSGAFSGVPGHEPAGRGGCHRIDTARRRPTGGQEAVLRDFVPSPGGGGCGWIAADRVSES